MCNKPGCEKNYCDCTCPNCMKARRARRTLSHLHCQRHGKNCHWPTGAT